MSKLKASWLAREGRSLLRGEMKQVQLDGTAVVV